MEQVALLTVLIFAAAVAALVALLGSVSLWWIYFDRTEEAAREAISSDDPGRVALSAYTYFHIPMIVGIIAVAADDELTLAHPGDRTLAAFVALTLGGTRCSWPSTRSSSGPSSGCCPGRAWSRSSR